MSDVATLFDFADELLTVANQALATTVGGAIDRAFVSPTLPALDCCAQLTVDVRSIQFETTSPTNPLPAIGHRATNALYLAVLVITVARCAPVVGQNTLPSIADMETSSRETTEDLWAIWNTLQALKREGLLFGGKCPALYIDPPVPLNAEGGCVGWVVSVRPAIDGYEPVLPS